jgi:hypothetical protein
VTVGTTLKCKFGAGTYDYKDIDDGKFFFTCNVIQWLSEVISCILFVVAERRLQALPKAFRIFVRSGVGCGER